MSTNITEKNNLITISDEENSAGIQSSPLGRVEGADVTELLPQQRPFVMIDRLVHIDETTVVSKFQIKSDNLFLDENYFTAPGIIENIAQTAAARMGYINKYVNKGDITLGFIGEVKNLVFEECPKINDELTTTVEITNEVLSTLLAKTEVRVNDKLIAHGNMKISMTDVVS